MREERMIVRPFDEFKMIEYHGNMQINEHAQAEIKGRIPFELVEEYMQLGKQHIWVQIVTISEESESILFYGILKELQLEVKNNTCIMSLILCSGTSLMDYKKRTRSFQSEDLQYGQLLDICNKEYDSSARIMTAAKNKPIGQFIMQYQETDWSFIKRLASRNHTVVVADYLTLGEKYFFGIPDRKEIIPGELGEYRSQCDMNEYWYKKNQGLAISPQDTISYLWESRDIYRLGDWGKVNGKSLYVWKIESTTKGSELYHTYYMKPYAGFQVPITYNDNLIGASLFGRVTKVKEEKIKIEITDDENKEHAGQCWFSYATIYSSPDGTGWYCMPEKGDQIRIYFPTNQDSEAYAASAYHEEGADLRTQPECKFWRNKEGKEIRLNPDRILITNNNGTYIDLSDDDGIEIVSSGSISIRAKDTLSVTSENSAIELTAPKQIRLKQGDAELELGDNLSMQGRKILL